MATQSQLPAGEPSNIALFRPPMMERPSSIMTTGSNGSRERHVLVRCACSDETQHPHCSEFTDFCSDQRLQNIYIVDASPQNG